MVEITEKGSEETTFLAPFLTSFSERFKALKLENPRVDVEILFRTVCTEFRIFGEKREKLSDIFMYQRSVIEIPRSIAAHNLEAPLSPPESDWRPIPRRSRPSISKKNSRFSIEHNGPDYHEKQLPTGDQ